MSSWHVLSSCPRPSCLLLTRRTTSPIVAQVRTSKQSKRRKDDARFTAPHLVNQRAVERTASVRALQHFDEHYGRVLGAKREGRWPSARLGLLSQRKGCALVNNFALPEETGAMLGELGCFSLRRRVADVMDQASQTDRNGDEDKPTGIEGVRSKAKQLAGEALDKDPDEKQEPSPSMALDDAARERYIGADERILGRRSQAAAMHSYMPSKGLAGMEDFVEDSQYYLANDDQYDEEEGRCRIRVIEDVSIRYPRQLEAFTFPSSVFELFPQPRRTVVGTRDYFCMDLASLLPVVALGLRPGETLLDTCAGPGGKALASAQTLLPSAILCNDHRGARLNRVRRVMDEYLGDVGGESRARIEYTCIDALELALDFPQSFDKVRSCHVMR